MGRNPVQQPAQPATADERHEERRGLVRGSALVRGLTLANRILGFTNQSSIWQHVIARCLDSLIDLAPLKRHRDRLVETLARKGYEVTAPDGTFYLFPRTPGGDDDAFARAAMNDLLLLVPGGAFGGPGFFRLAFCVDERTVDLAVERLPEAASVEARSAAGGTLIAT